MFKEALSRLFDFLWIAFNVTIKWTKIPEHIKLFQEQPKLSLCVVIKVFLYLEYTDL